MKFLNVADFTVLEVVKEFEAATGKKVAYDIVERRIGDVPSTYSTAALVEKELGWKANLTMKDMCKNFRFRGGNKRLREPVHDQKQLGNDITQPKDKLFYHFCFDM